MWPKLVGGYAVCTTINLHFVYAFVCLVSHIESSVHGHESLKQSFWDSSADLEAPHKTTSLVSWYLLLFRTRYFPRRFILIISGLCCSLNVTDYLSHMENKRQSYSSVYLALYTSVYQMR
jgi:hypothetical protein